MSAERSGEPSIQSLLDRHLRVLVGLGSNVDEYLSEGIAAAKVREDLINAGLEARQDVVDYFSWRTPQRQGSILFHETMFLPSISEALALRAHLTAYMVQHDELIEDFEVPPPPSHDYAGEDIPLYQGQPFLLPVAYLDSIDFVAVDTRSGSEGGRTYFCSQGNGGMFFLFDSLATMVRASTWLLETGRWQVHLNPGHPSYLVDEDDEGFGID